MENVGHNFVCLKMDNSKQSGTKMNVTNFLNLIRQVIDIKEKSKKPRMQRRLLVKLFPLCGSFPNSQLVYC